MSDQPPTPPTDSTPGEFDARHFRTVLGHFPTGVTVITGMAEGDRPHGFTIGSFTSVSLDPPLVLVCIDKKTETYPHFAPAGLFAVNFLALEQREVSQRFAKHGGDKFSDTAWHRGALGVPILDGTVGHVECRIVRAHDGGDHTIYVGEIEAGDAGDGPPLLYFRHAYRRVEDA